MTILFQGLSVVKVTTKYPSFVSGSPYMYEGETNRTKICDTVAVIGNKYLHHIGLAKWPRAELNNTVQSVYMCPAVCMVCCTTIWRLTPPNELTHKTTY